MLSKVRSFVDEHHLLARGEKIVAGVSGGADSAALFYVLLSLREERGFSFSVLHVHHGIRGPEADRDEAFVLALAEKFGVPARSVRLDVPGEAEKMGLGLEEAGRILRRRELLREMEAQGAQKIALAHHRDDLAETVLMNLARGTGLAGLGGIRPLAGPFIRPLLCVGRAEIEDYLAGIGASYVTDATNADNSYTRNRVRNEILPALSRYVNPKTNEHIAAAAAEAAEAFDYLSLEAEKRFRKEAVITSGEDGGKEVFLPESLILGQPAVMAGFMVRFSFSEIKGTLRDVTREHVRSVLALLFKEEGRKISLPYELAAARVPGGIRIGGVRRRGKAAEEAALAVPGRTVWGDWTFTAEFLPETDRIREENKCTKWIDYDKIKGNLVVRARKNGDFIVINPDGRKKTISDLMTDRKVPREMRDRLPLLAAGREVLLVPGIRTGESCRVDKETVRALRISAAKTEGRDI